MAQVTLRGLVKNYDDTPAVRGMINKVSYLLKCEG